MVKNGLPEGVDGLEGLHRYISLGNAKEVIRFW